MSAPDRVVPAEGTAVPAEDVEERSGRPQRRVSLAVLLVATAAAVFHMVPFWVAQTDTPDGYEFTGVLSGSPDALQYRMLMERSLITGPVVDNRLTTEPNEPHVLMIFYHGIGKVAGWLDVGAGYVYEYAGALFAFVLVVALFLITDHFLKVRYRTWWVLLAILLGGGLGAHLLVLNRIDRLRAIGPFQRIVTAGLDQSNMFEQYRNHFVFSTLFDSHFLFFLLVALAAVMAYYAAVARFSIPRMLFAAFMFGAATLLHIYDGVTLVFIAAGITFVLWLRKLPVRDALLTGILAAGAVGAAILWQLLLYRGSGLPIPDWRVPGIYFVALALAYALAWGLIAWGLGRYWRDAGVDECFLLGWILGCTVLTLSGPFYPYSDRGNMTLQVPLFIVAGAIYFSRHPRVTLRHAIIAVAILGVGPLWKTERRMERVRFDSQPRAAPSAYTWMSPDHQQVMQALHSTARSEDVLIVDKTLPPWLTDDLWLTQGFPGRLYVGHYAVTPEHDRKRAEVNEFFAEADPAAGPDFLAREGITLVYVQGDQEPERFAAWPGLRTVVATPTGTLLRYSP
jgi:hypothetical protein